MTSDKSLQKLVKRLIKAEDALDDYVNVSNDIEELIDAKKLKRSELKKAYIKMRKQNGNH